MSAAASQIRISKALLLGVAIAFSATPTVIIRSQICFKDARCLYYVSMKLSIGAPGRNSPLNRLALLQ
eukprot:1145918-Pelagomonas_calceolata.AAC.8